MTQEEAKILEEKNRWVNTKCIDLIHKSVEPKFKSGDVVELVNGESPKLVISHHVREELPNVKLTKTFNGKWYAVYYDKVKRYEPDGSISESTEPKEVEIDQRMYRIAEDSKYE